MHLAAPVDALRVWQNKLDLLGKLTKAAAGIS